MKTKLASIIVIFLFAAFFSGSATTKYGSSEATAAGWVAVENKTDSKTGPTTIGVKTSELVPRNKTSGGLVHSLFGFFTIADD
ncbi:MAG TPA: hypothetical protein DCS60_00775 [Opitutae bacterium]|nr:hypothetical protein [Opitutae bacterium]|tara:strand:+ start:348 stop:596 length:249 start_codon:yes stop_codon:yes gene_type:complete